MSSVFLKKIVDIIVDIEKKHLTKTQQNFTKLFARVVAEGA